MNPSPVRMRLPRLEAGLYRGRVAVHWTMTIHERKTGWLDAAFFAKFRELLLHSCFASRSVCPLYCLMPDHSHFLILGYSEESDSREWARNLRKNWNRLLAPHFELQKQAFDHVLREEERERDAFSGIAFYIAENPVRAGLADSPEDWPFTGCMVPGYPWLGPHDDRYWEIFWSIYSRVASAEGP